MHVLLCAVLILIFSYSLDVELRHFVQHRQHVEHRHFLYIYDTGDAGWSCFIKLILIFQEHSLSVKRFGPRSGPRFYVGPDLGPNCLQRLSADENSCRLQGKRCMNRSVLRMRDKYDCYLIGLPKSYLIT